VGGLSECTGGPGDGCKAGTPHVMICPSRGHEETSHLPARTHTRTCRLLTSVLPSMRTVFQSRLVHSFCGRGWLAMWGLWRGPATSLTTGLP